MIEIASLLAIGVTAITGIVYAVRLEGRVNVHDQLFVEREKTANERHEDLRTDLRRIEDKLDSLGTVLTNGKAAR